MSEPHGHAAAPPRPGLAAARGVLWVVAVAAAACSSPAAPSQDRLAPASGPMPAISGTTLLGDALGPVDYRGKLVLVNFWNPDCPPCREEQPVLQAAWEEHGADGLLLVGVMYVGGNWPNDPALARRYLEEEGVTYPTIVDGDSSLARGFGIAGIPTSVVADRDGRMRFRVLGRLRPGDVEALLERIETDG